MSKKKPNLSFWQIWNMSFGFLGIQFGFALQGGFMSRIFQTLGASKDDIPGLWIFAPLAGLIVQPIIGYLSDRTWSDRYGRRKPYFLIGAILASISLIYMPHSPVLWVAVGCLLILDSSINISMEPFRALVADKLNEEQRSYGFVVQTLIIGIGTWVASQLPKILTSLGVSNEAAASVVPANVKLAFAIGGFVFLLSILYTILTTKEYPPDDIEEFEKEKQATAGFLNGIKEIGVNIMGMPNIMKKLGIVQFFSWFAFFTMWSMATPALTEHVYKSPKPDQKLYEVKATLNGDYDSSILNHESKFDSLFVSQCATNLPIYKKELAVSDYNLIEGALSSPTLIHDRVLEMEAILGSHYKASDKKFNDAADIVGSAMGTYGLTSMIFALILTFVTSKIRINRKLTHMLSLICGGLGFLLMFYTSSDAMLNICFALIGISWGSILSMPYAMLSSSIDPKKMGIYMGIFNMFIVIPQIIASIGGINFLYKNLYGDATINTMLLAGTCLIIAGLSNFLITDRDAIGT